MKLTMSSFEQVSSALPALLFKESLRIPASDVADVDFDHDFEVTALHAGRS
jgi:hypothetical protein